MILGEIGTMLQLRTCAVPIVSCLPFTTITFCGSHASTGDLYNNYLLSRANGYLLRSMACNILCEVHFSATKIKFF